jgi:NitT/TauT family transport system ATP-binding protein
MRYELMRVCRSDAGRGCTVLFVTHSIAEAVLLSNRIVVLSARPGRIAGVVEVALDRRDEEAELTPQFIEYVRELRALLQGRRAA